MVNLAKLTRQGIRGLRVLKCVAIVSSILALSLMSLKVTAKINTHYLEAQKYTDIQNSDMGRKRSLKEVKKSLDDFFDKKDRELLAAGHILDIEIIDIDRAGDIRYNVTPANRELRVLRDTVHVRINLKYKLLDEAGNVIKEGSEKLKSFFTISGASARDRNRDQLYYEKRLLSEWLESLYK